MDSLHHLIYFSQSVNHLNIEALTEIAKLARFNNLIHQVTGLLIYGEQQFIQVLEGSKKNVELIFEKILLDSRHENIKVVTSEPLNEREFSNWNMGLAILENPHDIKKFAKNLNHEINFQSLTNYDASLLIKQFTQTNFRSLIR